MKIKKFKRNELIHDENHKIKFLYFIKEGEVEVRIIFVSRYIKGI
jgi:CRP-like cAMP-binding protein